MQVGEFLNKAYGQSLHFAAEAFIYGSIAGSLGFMVAYETSHELLFTQAFAIYGIAVAIFDRYCKFVTKSDYEAKQLSLSLKMIPSIVFAGAVSRMIPSIMRRLMVSVCVLPFIFSLSIRSDN